MPNNGVGSAIDGVLDSLMHFFRECEHWVPVVGPVLEMLMDIPEGRELDMYDLADSYGQAAKLYTDHLKEVAPYLNDLYEYWGGDGAAQAAATRLQEYIDQVGADADGFSAMQTAVLTTAQGIEATKMMDVLNLFMLAQAIIEVIMTIIETFGLSSIGAGVAIAACRTAIKEAIEQLWKQIAEAGFKGILKMIGKALLDLGEAALKRGWEFAKFTLYSKGAIMGIQTLEGHDPWSTFNPISFANEVVNSFLTGALGGPLGKLGGHNAVSEALSMGAGQYLDNLFKLNVENKLFEAMGLQDWAAKNGLWVDPKQFSPWEGVATGALFGAVMGAKGMREGMRDMVMNYEAARGEHALLGENRAGLQDSSLGQESGLTDVANLGTVEGGEQGAGGEANAPLESGLTQGGLGEQGRGETQPSMVGDRGQQTGTGGGQSRGNEPGTGAGRGREGSTSTSSSSESRSSESASSGSKGSTESSSPSSTAESSSSSESRGSTETASTVESRGAADSPSTVEDRGTEQARGSEQPGTEQPGTEQRVYAEQSAAEQRGTESHEEQQAPVAEQGRGAETGDRGAETTGRNESGGRLDEGRTPESKAPESQAPESKVPESKAPESKAPEPKAGESNTDPKAGETKTGEAKSGESKTGETRTGEEKPGGETSSGGDTKGGDRSGTSESGRESGKSEKPRWDRFRERLNERLEAKYREHYDAAYDRAVSKRFGGNERGEPVKLTPDMVQRALDRPSSELDPQGQRLKDFIEQHFSTEKIGENGESTREPLSQDDIAARLKDLRNSHVPQVTVFAFVHDKVLSPLREFGEGIRERGLERGGGGERPTEAPGGRGEEPTPTGGHGDEQFAEEPKGNEPPGGGESPGGGDPPGSGGHEHTGGGGEQHHDPTQHHEPGQQHDPSQQHHEPTAKELEQQALDSLNPHDREAILNAVGEHTVELATEVRTTLRDLADKLDRQLHPEGEPVELNPDGSKPPDHVQMVGEKYMVKGAGSLARKFLGEVAEARVSGDRPPTVEEFLDNANDIVRFSMQVPTEGYTGERVLSVLEDLNTQGYRAENGAEIDPQEVAKNFWREGNRFYGLNVTLREPSTRHLMELQFPSERSYEAGKLTHDFYEIVRQDRFTPEERVNAFLEIMRVNKEFELPTSLPPDLNGLPEAKYTSFADWAAKDPALWADYKLTLAQRGETFQQVTGRYDLGVEDFPRAEKVGLFDEPGTVRVLGDPPGGGADLRVDGPDLQRVQQGTLPSGDLGSLREEVGVQSEGRGSVPVRLREDGPEYQDFQGGGGEAGAGELQGTAAERGGTAPDLRGGGSGGERDSLTPKGEQPHIPEQPGGAPDTTQHHDPTQQHDPTHQHESGDQTGHEGDMFTGGSIRPRDDVQAWDWAEDAYDHFRSDDTDIAQIADHLSDVERPDGRTGFSADEIAQIKRHLMEEEHPLDDYNGATVERQFDADPDIAEAWIRLREGRPLESDLVLLEHELTESNYFHEHPGATYREAHEFANRSHNWAQTRPGRTGENYEHGGEDRQSGARTTGPRDGHRPGRPEATETEAQAKEREILQSLEPGVRQAIVDAVGEPTQKLARKVMRELLDIAKEFNQSVPREERLVTNAHGAEIEKKFSMVGQSHMVKGAGSLARKYADELALADAEDRPPQPVQDFLAGTNDIVRYSMAVPENAYTGERIVAVLERLNDMHYTAADGSRIDPDQAVKNFWARGNRFYGLNVTLREPSGHLFELQFPTERSFNAGKLTHKEYEVVRQDDFSMQKRVEAFLHILEINKNAGLPDHVPADLTGLPDARHTSFSEWVRKRPDEWSEYEQELAERGETFEQVVRRYHLTVEDFPRAEEAGLFDEHGSVRILGDLRDGGTDSPGDGGVLRRAEPGSTAGRHVEPGGTDLDLQSRSGGETALRRPTAGPDQPAHPGGGGDDSPAEVRGAPAQRGGAAPDLRGGGAGEGEGLTAQHEHQEQRHGETAGLSEDQGGQQRGRVHLRLSGDEPASGGTEGFQGGDAAGRESGPGLRGGLREDPSVLHESGDLAGEGQLRGLTRPEEPGALAPAHRLFDWVRTRLGNLMGHGDNVDPQQAARDAAERAQYEASVRSAQQRVHALVEGDPRVRQLRQEARNAEFDRQRAEGERSARRIDAINAGNDARLAHEAAESLRQRAERLPADDPRRDELIERSRRMATQAAHHEARGQQAEAAARRAGQRIADAHSRIERATRGANEITQAVAGQRRGLWRWANVDAESQFRMVGPGHPGPRVSALTGREVPPPVWSNRPYGSEGGLRQVLHVDQARLEQALRDGHGGYVRTPDPKGGWLRLLNAFGLPGDPTRGQNCLDAVASLFDTYVHGRPTVAAPRTFDGYRNGNGGAPVFGERGGPGRMEDLTGGRYQALVGDLTGQRTDQVVSKVGAGFDQIHQQLVDGGHGSFASIITGWRGGGSHAWAAVNHEGVVHFIDPQQGKVVIAEPHGGGLRFVDPTTGREVPHPIFHPAGIKAMDALVVDGQARPMPFGDRPAGAWNDRPLTAEYLDHQPPDVRSAQTAQASHRAVLAERNQAVSDAHQAQAARQDALRQANEVQAHQARARDATRQAAIEQGQRDAAWDQANQQRALASRHDEAARHYAERLQQGGSPQELHEAATHAQQHRAAADQARVQETGLRNEAYRHESVRQQAEDAQRYWENEATQALRREVTATRAADWFEQQARVHEQQARVLESRYSQHADRAADDHDQQATRYRQEATRYQQEAARYQAGDPPQESADRMRQHFERLARSAEQARDGYRTAHRLEESARQHDRGAEQHEQQAEAWRRHADHQERLATEHEQARAQEAARARARFERADELRSAADELTARGGAEDVVHAAELRRQADEVERAGEQHRAGAVARQQARDTATDEVRRARQIAQAADAAAAAERAAAANDRQAAANWQHNAKVWHDQLRGGRSVDPSADDGTRPEFRPEALRDGHLRARYDALTDPRARAAFEAKFHQARGDEDRLTRALEGMRAGAEARGHTLEHALVEQHERDLLKQAAQAAIPEPPQDVKREIQAQLDYVEAVRNRIESYVSRHPKVVGTDRWLRTIEHESTQLSKELRGENNPSVQKALDRGNNVRGVESEIALAERTRNVTEVGKPVTVKLADGTVLKTDVDVVADNGRRWIWRDSKDYHSFGVDSSDYKHARDQVIRQLRILLSGEYHRDGGPPRLEWHFPRGVDAAVADGLEGIRVTDPVTGRQSRTHIYVVGDRLVGGERLPEPPGAPGARAEEPGGAGPDADRPELTGGEFERPVSAIHSGHDPVLMFRDATGEELAELGVGRATLADLGFPDGEGLSPELRAVYEHALRQTALLDPHEIRFTQRSVSAQTSDGIAADELATLMRESGWRGGPIHAVRWGDGSLSSLDNRRLRAALDAGLERIPVVVHRPGEHLADWPHDWTPERQAKNALLGEVRELSDGRWAVGGDEGRVVFESGRVPRTYGEIAVFRAADQRSLLPGHLFGADRPPVLLEKPPPARSEPVLDTAERAALHSAVRDAESAAQAVRDRLETVATSVSGRLHLTEPIELRGVDHQVKDFESLARKYHDEAKILGRGVRDFLETVNDTVRFSLRLPEGGRYAETLVRTLEELRREGFEIVEAKNFWLEGNRHYGLNVTVRDPHDGLLVEIQFPTDASWRASNHTHNLYGVVRRGDELAARQVHAYLSILEVNKRFGLADAVPDGLADIRPPTDRGFADWASRHPDVWRTYKNWLAENGLRFADVVEEFHLDRTDFPVRGDVEQALEAADVELLRDLRQGGGFGPAAGDYRAGDPFGRRVDLEPPVEGVAVRPADGPALHLRRPEPGAPGGGRPGYGGAGDDPGHRPGAAAGRGHDRLDLPLEGQSSAGRGPELADPGSGGEDPTQPGGPPGEHRPGLDFRTAEPPLPDALPHDPNAVFADLREQCAGIADEQLRLAESLIGDGKYWFAKVYYHVTAHELQMIDEGRYTYPIMKMQEVVAFHETYKVNLDAWMSGRREEVEPNWRLAFQAAEDAVGQWRPLPSLHVMDALLPSMQAHIRFDLPRAIASVYEHFYADSGVPFDTFKRDFDRMQPVFDEASAALRPEIVDRTFVGDPGQYGFVQDHGFKFIFDVPRERLHAWEKAAWIVSGHEAGITDQDEMQQRLADYSRAHHPFSGRGAFKIGGTRVDGYDWNDQPGLGGPPAHQGGGHRARPAELLDADSQSRWANHAYELFRSDSADVAEIAANVANVVRPDGSVGFSLDEIAQVKQHVLVDPHRLDVYDEHGDVVGHEVRQFDPDADMAEAWIRLRRGEPLPQDVLLLEHELREARYLEEHPDATYARAHEHANERYNWERTIPERTGETLAPWEHEHGRSAAFPEGPGDGPGGGVPVRVPGDGPLTDHRQAGAPVQSGGRHGGPRQPGGAEPGDGAGDDRGGLAGRGRGSGLTDASSDGASAHPDLSRGSSTPGHRSGSDGADRAVHVVAERLHLTDPHALSALTEAYHVASTYTAPFIVDIAHDIVADLKADIAVDPGAVVVFVGRDGHSLAVATEQLEPEFFREHCKEVVLSRAVVESAVQDTERNLGARYPQLADFRQAAGKVAGDPTGSMDVLTRYLNARGVPVGEDGSHVILVDTSYKGTVQELLAALYPETRFQGRYAFFGESPSDPHPGSKTGYAVHLDAVHGGGRPLADLPVDPALTFAHQDAIGSIEETLHGSMGSPRGFGADGRPLQQPQHLEPDQLKGLNPTTVASGYVDPLVREAVMDINLIAVHDVAAHAAAVRDAGGDWRAELDAGASAFRQEIRNWISGSDRTDAQFSEIMSSFVRRLDKSLVANLSDLLRRSGLDQVQTDAIWRQYGQLGTIAERRAFVESLAASDKGWRSMS